MVQKKKTEWTGSAWVKHTASIPNGGGRQHCTKCDTPLPRPSNANVWDIDSDVYVRMYGKEYAQSDRPQRTHRIKEVCCIVTPINNEVTREQRKVDMERETGIHVPSSMPDILPFVPRLSPEKRVTIPAKHAPYLILFFNDEKARLEKELRDIEDILKQLNQKP